jgi:hypothetical protein
MNVTLGGGLTGNAVGSVTANTYTAYDLVSGLYGIIGALAVFGLILIVVLMPKKIQTLLVGYAALFFTGCGLMLSYVAVKSVKPVTEAVWFEWLIPFGKFLVMYGGYILATVPLAYFVGKKVEPFLEKVGEEKK